MSFPLQRPAVPLELHSLDATQPSSARLAPRQPQEGVAAGPPPALHHLGRRAPLGVGAGAAQPDAPQGEAREHAAAERQPAEAQGGAAPQGEAAVGDAAEPGAAEGGAALRGGREGRVADDPPGAAAGGVVGDGGRDLLQGLLGEAGALGPDGGELGAPFDVEHAVVFSLSSDHGIYATLVRGGGGEGRLRVIMPHDAALSEKKRSFRKR